MPNEATNASGAESLLDRSKIADLPELEISRPTADDAAEVHDLIAACPPLDTNSLYANLIQCTHFADSCAVARSHGRVVGWISGHKPPGKPDTYFLWQVAVHPVARGTKLPKSMLADILSRPQQAGVSSMETSITPSNKASWALFRSVATWLGAPIRDEAWFEHGRHFAGRHETERLVTIGPFRAGTVAR